MLLKILKNLSQKIIAKHQPRIILVAGSMGKTLAREAIYTVLSHKFKVRRNLDNYESKLGIFLTIIGAKMPDDNKLPDLPFKMGRMPWLDWPLIMMQAIFLLIQKNKEYPEVLILEIENENIEFINNFLSADMLVLTSIGFSNSEFTTNIQREQDAILSLANNLKTDAKIIINYDDDNLVKIIPKINKEILKFSIGKEGSDLRALEIQYNFQKENNLEFDKLSGIQARLDYKGSLVPIFLPNLLGIQYLYATLTTVAAGIVMEINQVELSEVCKNLEQIRGRFSLLKGVKNTIIIDDSYNSSPRSCVLALDLARQIPIQKKARRFAILGDMLELGGSSEKLHREVGEHVAQYKFNKLIAIGERSRDILRQAQKTMNKDNIFHFANSLEACRFVQDQIREGDLILIKGSRSMEMEKIVDEIKSYH